jgi:hypothetical protein
MEAASNSYSENISRRFSSRSFRAKARVLRTVNRTRITRMRNIKLGILFYLITDLFFPHFLLSFEAWTFTRSWLTAAPFCTLWGHKLLDRHIGAWHAPQLHILKLGQFFFITVLPLSAVVVHRSLCRSMCDIDNGNKRI